MVNRLSRTKRAAILHHLVEGASMRATTRLLGVGINTVARLLVDAGNACQAFHDAHVRDLTVRNIECDEIHGFVYVKQNRLLTALVPPTEAGDVYTWTALAVESKLIITWRVGSREPDDAVPFMLDLRSRLALRPQVTTDGHKPYLEAIHRAFGSEVDYVQLLKFYRESPRRCVASVQRPVTGYPDPETIGTSYVERHNLTIRMGVRRLTRKTNAFSKKIERHRHMLAIFFVFYNWVRPHMSLGNSTPAMAAGLATEPYDLEWLVRLVEARTPPDPMPPRPQPGRGPYRRRIKD